MLVCPQAPYAGHYWRDTYTLGEALAAAGAEVSAVVPTTPAGGGEFAGAVHHSLPRWWHRLTKKRVLGGNASLLAVLWNNFETLACVLRALPEAMSAGGGTIHLMGGTHIFIFLLAFASRRPVFLSIYGDLFSNGPKELTFKHRVRNWLLHHLLKQRKLVLLVETDSLRERWRWLFGEDVHTVPYAITLSPTTETKAAARSALGLPQDVPILLLFGTQREGKDYGVVLRAAKLIEPAVHLLFVGKTISQNNPQVLARELGFQQATFIDRFVDEAEVPRFFNAADAAVLPYAEGFDRGSGVIVDACGFGRPIIASDTGYLQWFVETYRAGFLYQPGDAADLAQVIQQFIALDSASRSEFEARVAYAADLHSWPQVIQTYIRLYRQYSHQGQPEI